MIYRKFGLKRVVDVVGASLGLLVASPALLVALVAVYVEDRHNPIFVQERVGRNGNPYRILKVRSMAPDTPDRPSTDTESLRITRTGAIMRRTNVDELPQLLNVLSGDMSLVGPRPALPSQDELVRLRGLNGASRLRPGLTGLAQIRAYDGMSATEKARLDGEYARSVSFLTDARIVLRTLPYLFRRPPTY
ncbi:MAG TPA: sugar transferase [Longimicrobiales bacterium]|nr:sugar transferase [Longimicrobiales bacterium]